MIFEALAKGYYVVSFEKDNGEDCQIYGRLSHVLESVASETSVDVETIILSGDDVVQPLKENLSVV